MNKKPFVFLGIFCLSLIYLQLNERIVLSEPLSNLTYIYQNTKPNTTVNHISIFELELQKMETKSNINEFYPPEVTNGSDIISSSQWALIIDNLEPSDRFLGARETKDGGFVAVGESGNFFQDTNTVWVVKTDVAGKIEWENEYPGTGGAVAFDIQQTSDEGFIVVGDIDFATENYTWTNAWVLKLDSIGEIEWQKKFGTSGGEHLYAVLEAEDGGFIVAGATRNLSHSIYGLIIKLDKNGNIIWQKKYGAGDESFHSIAKIANGYVAVGGTGSYSSTSQDGWLVKVDEGGDVSWQRKYIGEETDYFNSINTLADGGFIVGGYSNSFSNSTTDTDYWVLNLSDSGYINWQVSGGADDKWDEIKAVLQSNDGGYIALGYGWHYNHIFKLDSNGNLIWGNKYDVAGLNGMGGVSSGGYIVAGEPNIQVKSRALLLKVDNWGQIPGCDLMVDSPLAITNTDGTVATTSLSYFDSFLIDSSTNIIANDSYATTEMVCDSCRFMGDDDKDSIPDGWELCGYHHSNGGFVDLPGMGASIKLPDIFVEVDYMTNDNHSHKPNDDAMRKVIKAFAEKGIRLHIDYGEEAIISYGDSQTWGDLSNAEPIVHKEDLEPPDGSWNVVEGWEAFDAIKSNHFRSERWPIFHYGIFGHNLGGGMPDYSGISRNSTASLNAFRNGASDFVISLGEAENQTGSLIEQSGTFMHELGHNLGLTHGGDDDKEYEPNYLSVMNYSFQTSGLVYDGEDGRIDYSRFGDGQIPDLVENDLDESVGLNGNSIDLYGTRWYCRNSIFPSRRKEIANSFIDWNCDFLSNKSVEANINDGDPVDSSPTGETLTTFNDWDHLVFSGGSIFGEDNHTFNQLFIADEFTYEELDLVTARSFYVPYSVSIGSSNDLLVVSPGVSKSIPVTVTNTGDLTSTITFSTTYGSWFNLSTVPMSVTLASKEKEMFQIGLNVSQSSEPNERQSVSLEAILNESPLMTDIMYIDVTVGPLAWYDAAPITGIVPHTVYFTDLSMGKIDSWLWDFGDGKTSNLKNPWHTYVAPGSYQVKLTVSGSEGSNSFISVNPIRIMSKTTYLPAIFKGN